MTKEFFSRLEAYMLSAMEDSAHDPEHIYRVLHNALLIAQEEEVVDYDVLITACLLHDVGRKAQFADPQVCHAQAGSEMAYHYLMEQGKPEEFCEQVRHCIRTHRFRSNDQPRTIEARILFDADKLDVTGALGIARTLMYKGNTAEPIYHLRPDGSVSDGTEDDRPSFFREYVFKLDKIYDRFYTAKGAQLAENSRQAAKDFYDALYQQITQPRQQGISLLKRLLDSADESRINTECR